MSTLLLIQSDPVAGQRLRAAFDADPRLTVGDCVGTLAAARRCIAARAPDLLIADLRLPDGAVSTLLRERRPGRSHSLVVTASLHDPHLMHALRSGADGFVLAGCPTDSLLDVVRMTLAGGAPLAPEIARQILALFDVLNARPLHAGAANATALSTTERRLLTWTSEGYLRHELARGLGVTTPEVDRLARDLYRRIRFEPPLAKRLRRAA